MCSIENLELIKKYICDEIMNFEPNPTKSDNLRQLEDFIRVLIYHKFQGILCLYQRAVDAKQKYNEYERALNELKEKIPDISI